MQGHGWKGAKARRKRHLGGLGLLVLASVLFALLQGNGLNEMRDLGVRGAAAVRALPEVALTQATQAGYALWHHTLNAARGPARVGIQVGHENVAAHPDELANLRYNTGGHANGVDEVVVNRAVAAALKGKLEAQGVTVDLLSATPPPGYYADLVVSLHADSVADPARRGYKSAIFEPVRNPLERQLKNAIDGAYLSVSGLPDDHVNTTSNMRRYYAFNARRYRHSIHPGTPSLIVEMGYLNSAADMAFLGQPELPAAALSQGITEYLRGQIRLRPAE